MSPRKRLFQLCGQILFKEASALTSDTGGRGNSRIFNDFFIKKRAASHLEAARWINLNFIHEHTGPSRDSCQQPR